MHYQRRLLLGSLALSPLNAVANSKEGVKRGSSSEISRWLIQAQNSRGKEVGGGLKVYKFSDFYWVLLAPIFWKPSPGNAGPFKSVIVPPGFVTDFASIPRVFWSSLAPTDEYGFAAIVHDFLYWVQDRSKDEADAILNLAMSDLVVSDYKHKLIMLAVKSYFGRSAWQSNAELRKLGEQRIVDITTLPTDPRVAWGDFRNRLPSHSRPK